MRVKIGYVVMSKEGFWAAVLVSGRRRLPWLGLDEVGVLAFLVGLYAFMQPLRPLPQLGFGQDLGILLEAGWRFVQGQMPHRDYMSPLGPVYALIAGIPLACSGTAFTSYKYLPFAMSCVFSILCIVACRNRLPAGVAFPYSVLVGLVGGGTYHFGFAPELLTFATIFNRLGWASLMVLGVVYSIPARCDSASVRYASGVMNGALLGVILFLKINYLVVAVFMWGSCAVVMPGPRHRQFVVGSMVAGLIVTAFCLSMIGWDLPAMLRDLMISFESRRASWEASPFWDPGTKFLSNLDGVLAVIVLAIACGFRRAWPALVAGGAITLSGFVICNSNSSGSGAGIPVLVTAMAALASRLHLPSIARVGRDLAQAVVLWGFVLTHGCLVIAVPQCRSYMVWQLATKLADEGSIQQFHNVPKPLAGLVVGSVSGPWFEGFVEVVKDGALLIDLYVKQEDTLLYVDFTNIFNFATRRQSPRHTSLWYDRYATLNPHRYIDKKTYFSDVRFVLFPKGEKGILRDNMHVADWMAIYGEQFEQAYSFVEESRYFVLYERKP